MGLFGKTPERNPKDMVKTNRKLINKQFFLDIKL